VVTLTALYQYALASTPIDEGQIKEYEHKTAVVGG
jgi:hypothetical protein